MKFILCELLCRTYQSSATNKWVLKFYHREQRNNRALGVIKSCTVSHEQIPEFENELDRKALWAFLGMATQAQSNHYYSNYYTPKKGFRFFGAENNGEQEMDQAFKFHAHANSESESAQFLFEKIETLGKRKSSLKKELLIHDDSISNVISLDEVRAGVN